MELPEPMQPDQAPEGNDESKLPEPNEPSRSKPRFGFFRRGEEGNPGKPDDLPNPVGEPKIGSFPESSLEKLISQKPLTNQDGPGSRVKTASSPLQPDHKVQSPSLETPARGEKEMNPGRRLHAMEEAAKSAPPARLPFKYRVRPNRDATRRAYWDVMATLSLIVNAILVALLIIMGGQVRQLKSTVNDLLGGLYGNFVKMDQASINTTVAVSTEIPLSFTLPVSQNTEVVLSGDVSIPRAHVVINTGVLNINAQANVTLPAGTTLPITMNMGVPVQTTIPVVLQVPVTIPLNQTGLHEPFTGLQTTILPLYCALDKNAQYPEGTFICAEQGPSSPPSPSP